MISGEPPHDLPSLDWSHCRRNYCAGDDLVDRVTGEVAIPVDSEGRPF